MKILHLIAQLSGGGAERQLNYLAPEMARANHEIHVAYLRGGPEEVSLPCVILHHLEVSSNYDPRLLLDLFFLIRKIRPDIIHSWTLIMDIMIGLLWNVTKAIWILREPTGEDDYRVLSGKQRMRAYLARRASMIVCNSQSGKAYWLSQHISEKAVVVLPNAVPLDLTGEIPPYKFKDQDKDKTLLLYAGRLVSTKNVDLLIKAMAEIKRKENTRLLIAGEGPARAELLGLVERHNLRDEVRFVGHLQKSDLWAYMKASDAFISLSKYEGMPNCVCEAIACDLPLVLSDIAAHRFILDNESAVFVNTDSIADVTWGILSVLKHKGESKERAFKAKKIVAAWSPASIACQYICLYEKMVQAYRI